MFKEIKIGDKDVSLLANASTSIRYRMIFHKDLIAKMGGKLVADDVTDMAAELAFVMAKTAEGADMNTLNINSFFEWLGQFEVFDIANASDDIFNVYTGQEVTTSTAKKKQSAKQSVN